MLILAGIALSIILVAVATAQTRNQVQVPISQVIADVRAGQVARIELNEGSNEISVFYKDPARGKVTAIKEWQVSVQEALTAGDVPASAMPDIVVERTANTGGLFGFLMLAAIVGSATFLIIRGQGRSAIGGVGKSKARNVAMGESLPRVTFDDVAGVDEAKQELTEIVEFLKHPEKFSRMGARSPKGVLLVGPPGTGKTLISRAVAGQAGVPFFSISGSEFVEMFVGVGASRVRDLFAQARKSMPCVIFIDEIDAVGRRRSSGHMHVSNEEREQTLNQLLVEMDGFDNRTHIIVIAATNRPDVLDPALLRPGRFDRQVMLDKPDIKGRTAILKVHARGKPLEKGVTLDTIAKMTPGFSGADLENLVNEAAILAVRRSKHSVGLHELEEAVDRVLAGPERKSRIISEQEKAITAYHEVGHALTARMLAHVDPVHKVSIIARGMAGGYTRVLPGEDRYLQSRSQFNDYLVFILGGRAAEEVIFDEVTTGASNDLERATDIARGMVMKYGMSQRLGLVSLGRRAGGNFLGGTSDHEVTYSEEVARTIDEEVRNLVNEAYARAINILTTHKEKLVDISELLIERETLDGTEFEALFEGIPRPQPRAARLRKSARTTMPLLSPDMMAAGLAHVPVENEGNTPG
ncbi:MAG TPA: ATP-dependent zinc metalloprotease FtsH [Chloroflexia bacterium]|nr:ATP-dependent zinc metalloprotease FtsH [Chloroflexia bacterium]